MTTLERVAYLKGLADGMKIDESTNEGKLLIKIIDVLEDVAADMADIEDEVAVMAEQIDEIDDDLALLEDDYYEDYEDDDCDCGHHHHDHEHIFEVECPACGDIICLDEDMLDEGEITCPGCGEKLEFDFDDDEDLPFGEGIEE